MSKILKLLLAKQIEILGKRVREYRDYETNSKSQKNKAKEENSPHLIEYHRDQEKFYDGKGYEAGLVLGELKAILEAIEESE
jgi:hypothetical protein